MRIERRKVRIVIEAVEETEILEVEWLGHRQEYASLKRIDHPMLRVTLRDGQFMLFVKECGVLGELMPCKVEYIE
jgi:hypothetical protein